jgi:alpha-N-arabinofuranosidase
MVPPILLEVNFCLTESFQGDKTTTYGAIRASLGYQNPFTIDYVEIGNEDYLNGGSSSYYSYRFDAFTMPSMLPIPPYISFLQSTPLP